MILTVVQYLLFLQVFDETSNKLPWYRNTGGNDMALILIKFVCWDFPARDRVFFTNQIYKYWFAYIHESAAGKSGNIQSLGSN